MPNSPAKNPKKPKPPAKPRKKKATKHNYELAQRYYVEGIPVDEAEPDGDRDWPNLRVVSEKTNIPYERIRERSALDRWTDLKVAYQKQSAMERQKQRIERMGKEAIEFDSNGLKMAKMGMQLIGIRMSEIAATVKASQDRHKDAVDRLSRGEPVERQELWSQIRAEEVERLAKAAATWQEIGRKALGTDIERVQIDAQVAVEQTISVAAELERDDPDRLAAFMAAAERAGIWEQLELTGPDEEPADDGDVVEAELVE